MNRLPIGLPRVFARYDLNESGLLPSNWVEQIEQVVAMFGKSAELRGGIASSLEAPGTVIPYELVDGRIIERELHWLHHLYQTHFLELASAVHGETLLPSDSTTNGVNLNCLRGTGGRYELHVDTNPLTGLLFVTTHAAEDGGQLIFSGGVDRMSCTPVSGHLLLFDARDAPHFVTALKVNKARISAPMNFFTEESLSARPADLDSYLYS